MNRVCGILVCLLLVSCALHGNVKKDHAVRQRFVPGSVPTNPSEAGSGASWTAFIPFGRPDTDKLTVLASAGIGDKFPVAMKDGDTLFEVRMKDGNDDRVCLEIITKEGTKDIEVQRDKPVQIEVAGVVYTISYPSIEVAASSNQPTTTKAELFISTPRK